MVGKRIVWTLTAIRSLNAIASYFYIRNKSNTYSRKIISEIHKRTRILKQQPFIGKRAPNSDKRVLIILHYHLFYKITDKTINILDIWDGRRDTESIKYYKKDL